MKKLLLILFCLVLTQTVTAQDFWMQKSYQRWTKDEIIKMISSSPWAQVVGDTGNDQVLNASYVTIRLRSAITIRQALVRLKQIEASYDKMDKDKKAEFDKKMQGTLDCPACQNNYVITVSPPISDRQLKSGIFSLVNVKFEQLKDNVYLINDKNERRNLVHFIAPLSNDGEATFFFPRLDDSGKPLLTADNKTFTLIFEKKGSSSFQNKSIPTSTSFDVTKMLIDKNVEF
jgi:hypothetical protein